MLNLDKPKIMGILNVTPDSFSDGGSYSKPEDAVKKAEEMIKEGADIIDIGGESSGPGSTDISAKEELKRVLPVVKALREKFPNVPLSVDTYKSEVAQAVLDEGVQIINDVTALRGDPDLADVVAKHKAYLVLMYSKNETARTTEDRVEYVNVVSTILEFLRDRVFYAMKKDIPKQRIIVDPGLGFFLSSADHPEVSFEVINKLDDFRKLSFPVMIAPSRKSFLGGDVKERVNKTAAAVAICAYNGADIIRVHDIKECKEAMEIGMKTRIGASR